MDALAGTTAQAGIHAQVLRTSVTNRISVKN